MPSPFPGASDTDATLFVAADRIQTTLSVAQAATDTVLIVASTSGWVANMIASVDAELELVTGVVGANTLQVTRNITNTGAVVHAAGSTVSNYVCSPYHYGLSNAIQAIQNSLTAGVTWPRALELNDSAGIYQWHFNDTQQGVGCFSMFGTSSKPMSSVELGDYHLYYQNVGADGTNTYSAFNIDAHLSSGTGNALVGIRAACTADGTWGPGSGAVGVATKGPIGGNFSASTSQGGYALGALINASNTNTAASAVSGIEVNVSCFAPAAGQAGVLVVAMSGGAAITGPAATNYGYGLTAAGSASQFAYGFLFQSSGTYPVAPSGTLIASLAGSVAAGIDFSQVTFSQNAIATRGFTVDGSGNVSSGAFNFIGVETGAANAIAASGVSGMITGVQLAILLGHSLQAGPNTFNYNAGGAKPIRSSRNPANNIATAYVAGGVIRLLWDGAEWLDLSQ